MLAKYFQEHICIRLNFFFFVDSRRLYLLDAFLTQNFDFPFAVSVCCRFPSMATTGQKYYYYHVNIACGIILPNVYGIARRQISVVCVCCILTFSLVSRRLCLGTLWRTDCCRFSTGWSVKKNTTSFGIRLLFGRDIRVKRTKTWSRQRTGRIRTFSFW